MKTKLLIVFSLASAALMLLLAPAVHAQTFVYDASLDGPSENPPNASPATGFATVTVDLTLNTLRVQVSFSGLTGTTTASHIHAPTSMPGSGTAGVATQTPSFSAFPLGVTSGTYDMTFDMMMDSTWNPSYESANGGTAAGAEAAFVAALNADEAYLNIHTDTFPGGEIRGFLRAVPEPSTIALIATGAIGLLLARRRKSRS